MDTDSTDAVFEAGGKKYSTRELLAIDDTDLNNEFATQAARFAYFAVLTAQAEYEYQLAKDAADREDALAFIDAKEDNDNIPTGGRTVSDELAKKLAMLDEDNIKKQEERARMLLQYRTMRALSDAFAQRASMLQSLGANLRQELDMTGLATRETNPANKLRKEIARRKET